VKIKINGWSANRQRSYGINDNDGVKLGVDDWNLLGAIGSRQLRAQHRDVRREARRHARAGAQSGCPVSGVGIPIQGDGPVIAPIYPALEGHRPGSGPFDVTHHASVRVRPPSDRSAPYARIVPPGTFYSRSQGEQ
jgi:hypothetical protein